MLRKITFLTRTTLVLLLATATAALAADRVIIGGRQPRETGTDDNRVIRRCLTPHFFDGNLLSLEREKPWSLPKAALSANFADTISILVLRYNFQYEQDDDPNTTGRGLMDDSTDVETFLDTAGHFIDPPPHDSLYFDAHMRALRTYWEIVSDGRISLRWDIYPAGLDSVYQLPQPMSYYGRCEYADVIPGLESYFIDAVHLADTTSPEIDFGRYQSLFLFHAGSDRQNDIGFPPTCADLFTGFITFGDSLGVDNDSNFVRTALLVPETSNQDNRGVALNAVMAHEFGHQLGLIDLYSTATFMSMLGDFALMDNNGFGSGIDFGFEVGSIFGAIPLYPIAWSRAFLGFVDVVDYRRGSDVRLVAAEIVSDGIKAARVPITENEYYLIENRVVDIDNELAAARLDSATNVILGPTDTSRVFNREYDFLLPGSGVLIYHVDERVAALDYDYDGINNFDDNHLQWAHDIFGNPVDRFITLVEADGIVNFGGYYRSGFGSEEDMFRDDRNHAFTPNTNPAAIDNSGNNTHIYITDITRDPQAANLIDTVVLFDIETDRLAEGFPVRAGYPALAISPVADDIDGDGAPEVIFVSGQHLCVATTAGENFLREFTGCTTCPVLLDTAFSSVSAPTLYPVPLYALTPGIITAGPVTGRFADSPEAYRMIAVGYNPGAGPIGRVDLYSLKDDDNNGEADLAYGMDTGFFATTGAPLALSFGDVLFAVTDSGRVYRKETFVDPPAALATIDLPDIFGLCRDNDALIVMAGDESSTSLFYYAQDDVASFDLPDRFLYGPVLADINLDDVPEMIAATPDGQVLIVAVDATSSDNPFTVVARREFEYQFTADPVVADVDLDGYPEIVIGGVNAVYALNHELTLKTDFPLEVNDRYAQDEVSAAPVVADIDGAGLSDIIFPTQIGNLYSFGLAPSFGFPLSAGEMAAGSAVLLADATSGRLGCLGSDGWFYLWNVSADNTTDFWPMRGADPEGTFLFDSQKLPPLKQYASRLPAERFFNYPNPVVDGVTTIRYFLSEAALGVTLTVYDLSGKEIASLAGPVGALVDHEVVWECGDIVPGVYRCLINVDFGGQSETAFHDIAIIK
ncbi:MAG: hypothetical protein JSW34_13185 [Candidatus Zixiibacteriota bacterium]|nr:MAG: hypothetical protein JSW34_13185 [candidate division Zixibacteria bacterium]